MMIKFVPVLLLISSPLAFSQVDATEQALILNQEMQFLEESARNAANIPLPGSRSEAIARRRGESAQSLERTYFGDVEEDSVQTRTAAPKRRVQ